MNNMSEAQKGGETENPEGGSPAAMTGASENGAVGHTSMAMDTPEAWKFRYEELRRIHEEGKPGMNEELSALRKRTAELESALKVGVTGGAEGGARDAGRGAGAQRPHNAVIENLVSPAHSSTPAATGAFDTEVFSEDQIRVFYNALSRGKFNGTAHQAREVEMRINKAVKEGRVTGR